MFDQHARSLFFNLEEFDGFTERDCTRALTRAYLAIIQLRINGINESPSEAEESQRHLRRIANTLMFRVVLNDTEQVSRRRAAAFVVAEAIALMADYIRSIENSRSFGDARDSEGSPERFARVESALLYLYSEYDACAASVLRDVGITPRTTDNLRDQAAEHCLREIERLCRFELYQNLEYEGVSTPSFEESPSALELEEDTVARLYFEVAGIVREFSDWLCTGASNLARCFDRLERILATLGEKGEGVQPLTGNEFARVFHLCTLLRLCLPSLGERALIHVVPPPSVGDEDRYASYLRNRAVGSERVRSRPLLWPSAMDYVQSAIVGDAQHVIVSMPTGSGKSFIAELAISQAIGEGWALYLAPTNALTEQIRGDLRVGLSSMFTDVRAFIGDREYSTLESDRVADMPSNSVAVMTPEKCALALRIAPNAFDNCRLVVFDECHLIGDTGSSRGVAAELVLTQLMLRAPCARFLLMSAIIQNPEDLAEWVGRATGGTAKALAIKWRPTRTLRTVLGVGHDAFLEASTRATQELSEMPDRRRRLTFSTPSVLAAGLRGAWQSKAETDYAVVAFDCEVTRAVKRSRSGPGGWQYVNSDEGWVNATAVSVGRTLSSKNIQTLVFTPASKHYPFANGRRVGFERAVLKGLRSAPAIVGACKRIAEYELGCASEAFELLSEGVAVHTSTMLESEKIAAEAAFRAGSAALMFATGTLAQGLNLPAIAVVIAGTNIGDSRGEEKQTVERRKLSQLLNAAGRAGRAGFANQGIVIAVSDKPIAFKGFEDVLSARRSADYLQHSDDSVAVHSGLSTFMDELCERTLTSHTAGDLELQIVSLLGGGDTTQLEPYSVLRSTYAAYLREKSGSSRVLVEDAEQVVEIGKQFIRDTGAPEWLTAAAQRAGIDFFLAYAIAQAWERVRNSRQLDYEKLSVIDWARELIRLIVYVPPGLLAGYLPKDTLRNISRSFYRLDDGLFLKRELDEDAFRKWELAWRTAVDPLVAWMRGATIAEIASILCECSADEMVSNRGQGKPLPKALAVTGHTWGALGLIAGGLLSIAEHELGGEVPLALACLPMCIKYGCDTPMALAWYRFGVRLRRPSRLLAERFGTGYEPTTDSELRAWVERTRRAWLMSDGEDEEEGDGEVIGAVRTFLTLHSNQAW